MSVINEAVEAVIGMLEDAPMFAAITRGALGTGDCITCEVGPSTPSEVYLDKEIYVPLSLVVNAKHRDLQIVTDSMNVIHRLLTTARTYPRGDGWRIVDISNSVLPQIIGREEDNRWLVSSRLAVKLYTGV